MASGGLDYSEGPEVRALNWPLDSYRANRWPGCPVVQLKAQALEQPGKWSTGQVSSEWMLDINRAFCQEKPSELSCLFA